MDMKEMFMKALEPVLAESFEDCEHIVDMYDTVGDYDESDIRYKKLNTLITNTIQSCAEICYRQIILAEGIIMPTEMFLKRIENDKRLSEIYNEEPNIPHAEFYSEERNGASGRVVTIDNINDIKTLSETYPYVICYE